MAPLLAASGPLLLGEGANPLVPVESAALGWAASVAAATVVVAGYVSLLRSPLDERARLPWALAMLGLPVLGALIWFWWRHRYYPVRRASQPGWDPNARAPQTHDVGLRRTPAPTRLGRADPYAGHAAPEGLAPRRRYGMGSFVAPRAPRTEDAPREPGR